VSTVPGVAVGGDVGLHRRHPVAEEHVDVAGGERGVGDRDREDLDLGLVAQRLEHDVVAAVVAVMSVQPTSEKTIVSQSAKAAEAAAHDGEGGKGGLEHLVSPIYC
jgi:hypothetical protein